MILRTTKIELFNGQGQVLDIVIGKPVEYAYEKLATNSEVSAAVIHEGYGNHKGTYMGSLTRTLITRAEFDELVRTGKIKVSLSKAHTLKLIDYVSGLTEAERDALRDLLKGGEEHG